MQLLAHLEPQSTATGPAALQDQFAALYAEYFEPIYRYCRIRLGDAAAAEDATSHVFSNALAAVPRYGDPRIRAWLFSIAHNVVINLHRGREQCGISIDEAHEIPDHTAQPEDEVIVADERRQLKAALSALTGLQREAVELRLAGLTGVEIAETLGLTHAAVKMHQYRAFQRLRDLLSPNGPEGGSHRD